MWKDESHNYLRNGYYKFPSVARVIMYLQIKGNKISFYRSHAGHYAGFGKYQINYEDSTIIVTYNKTVASRRYTDMEPLDFDTIGFAFNKKNQIELFGLTYVEHGSEEFYKSMSKRIMKNSKTVK